MNSIGEGKSLEATEAVEAAGYRKRFRGYSIFNKKTLVCKTNTEDE